jgi:uncharacterized protein YgiM (DUF1202 family)
LLILSDLYISPDFVKTFSRHGAFPCRILFKEIGMSLRKSVLFLAMTAGAITMLPAALWAQQQPEAAATEIPNAKFTVVGEVNATSVNVRSGPAESHYPTMRLNKGDKVIVVGQKFDWLKIQPPQGSFSYIAKIYVDRDGAGTSGTVSGNDVQIRAGSLLSPMNDAPQTKLSTGAKVQILGEQDEYYKIVPPEGAYLYIAKQFVAVVRQATTGETAPPPAVVPQPAATQPVEATTQPAPAAVPQASEDAELEFRRLEARHQQTEAQLLEDRPLTDLLKEYEQLGQKAASLSATSKRMVLIRVAELKALQQQQAELLQVKQAAADFQAKQAELQTQRQAIEQRIKASEVVIYTALGQLQTSALQKDGQTLLRLIDPADGQTLIYVHSTDAKNASLIGTFVGVRGEIAKDARLAVDVLEPTSLEPVDQAKVMRGITAKIYPPSATKGQ